MGNKNFKNKTTIFVVIVLFLCFVVYTKYKDSDLESLRTSQNTSYNIFTSRDSFLEQTHTINLSERKIVSQAVGAYNLNDFIGISKNILKNGEVQFEEKIISEDGTRVMFLVTDVDTQGEMDYNGQYYVLRRSSFICEIVNRTCIPSNALIDAYQSVNTTDPLFEYSKVKWVRWDSVKNMLYGFSSYLTKVSSQPMYIYDMNTRTLNTFRNDASIDDNSPENVSNGFMSPSLSLYAVQSELNAKKYISIYDLHQPDKLLSRHDISTLQNSVDIFDIKVIGWSHDEKKIALIYEKDIFVLDTTTGDISRVQISEDNFDFGYFR